MSKTPRYDEWCYLRTHGQWRDGVPVWARGPHNRTMDDMTAAHAVIEELAQAVTADTAGAKPLSAEQKQSLEAKVMEGFDVSKLKHEDGCRWWQDETFCTCGADQAELCRRWKSHALYWKDVANEYERVWMEESQRLLIANGCCERLMNACTDAGCPDGVRMDDWIRENCRASPAIDAAAPKPVAWMDPQGDANSNVISAAWKTYLSAHAAGTHEHEHAAKHTVALVVASPAIDAAGAKPWSEEQEREAFEDFARKNGCEHFGRINDGYVLDSLDENWRYWLEARAALASSAIDTAPFRALVEMCQVHGDFSNGVTDPTGTIDEGEVRAGEIIDEAAQALRAIDAAPRVVHPITANYVLSDKREACSSCGLTMGESTLLAAIKKESGK